MLSLSSNQIAYICAVTVFAYSLRGATGFGMLWGETVGSAGRIEVQSEKPGLLGGAVGTTFGVLRACSSQCISKPSACPRITSAPPQS